MCERQKYDQVEGRMLATHQRERKKKHRKYRKQIEQTAHQSKAAGSGDHTQSFVGGGDGRQTNHPLDCGKTQPNNPKC